MKVSSTASTLGVGTVEHGKIGIFTMFSISDALDLVAHDDGFFTVAIGWFEHDRVALIVFAVHIFGYLSFIVPDYAVGGLHYALRTAVPGC